MKLSRILSRLALTAIYNCHAFLYSPQQSNPTPVAWPNQTPGAIQATLSAHCTASDRGSISLLTCTRVVFIAWAICVKFKLASEGSATKSPSIR